MILIGNQRGGATNLARHLLKEENEQVDVIQVRGFASDDLHLAFRESYAMSRATKCRQHLFSLSLNPPKDAELSADEFERTVDRAEESLGLSGQPRAIVLHTKNGRTHPHAVWSRINVDEMRAVQMSFSKSKMQDLSRELYREHGWTMPRGLVRHAETDPRNYTLAEWQQCKRTKRDPAKTKEIFQDAWAVSDSRAAFAAALQSHGFFLAKGDRRGHIAVDHNGEAFAISRYVGIKAKQVRDRLGKTDELPSKEEAHSTAANRIVDRLGELQGHEKKSATTRLRHLAENEKRQNERQTTERAALLEQQNQEQQRLREEQQARLRTGFMGLVDRLTGKRRRMVEHNKHEAHRSDELARLERQRLNEEFESRKLVIQQERNTVSNRAEAVHQELALDMRRLRELAQNHGDGGQEQRDKGVRPNGQRRDNSPALEP